MKVTFWPSSEKNQSLFCSSSWTSKNKYTFPFPFALYENHNNTYLTATERETGFFIPFEFLVQFQCHTKGGEGGAVTLL